jgi:hypothetical protein
MSVDSRYNDRPKTIIPIGHVGEEKDRVYKTMQISSDGVPLTKITDGTNVAGVNEKNQLKVVLDGRVDNDNSTTQTLGAGATYTGTATSTLDYAIISVTLKSNVASATDGLCVEKSHDGINWDFIDKYTVPADSGKEYSFQTSTEYYRVIYTNGGVSQTTFRLQSVLKKTNTKPSSHRVQDPIIDDDDAELVTNVNKAKKPNGTYVNIGATNSGNLKAANVEDGLSIAKGDVVGSEPEWKFGNAPDFDTSDGEVTIWDGAEDGTAWEQMKYQYSTTADIDSISSSDVNDTVEIVVEGLDTNWTFVSQTVTLNGQTRVALGTSLIRCFRAYNNNSTNLVGHVIVYVNTALSSGVPTDTTKIRAIIDPVNQQTEMTLYTIPAGKTGYMRSWYVSTAGASRSSEYIIKRYSRLFEKVFRMKHVSAISDIGTSSYQHFYKEPQIFTEKTDIEFTAQMTVSAGTGANISAGFDLVLIDN